MLVGVSHDAFGSSDHAENCGRPSRHPRGRDPSPVHPVHISSQFHWSHSATPWHHAFPPKPFTEFVSPACTTPQKQYKESEQCTTNEGQQGGHELQDGLSLMEIDLLFLKRSILSRLCRDVIIRSLTFARTFPHSFLRKSSQRHDSKHSHDRRFGRNQLQML